MDDSPPAARRADEPRSVLEYLRRATEFFAARGIGTARLDAEVLLAFALATDRVGVYLRFDQPLGAREIGDYRELVRRRAAGTPVGYLTGTREFWSMALTVTPDVLIPRPETELLVERVLAACAPASPRRLLDLGTGSGALAITLARELRDTHVVAVDVSPAAVRVAAANARRLGVADRVAFVVGDWTGALGAGARFDVIVSNPPYVATAELAILPADVRAEPAVALDGGADGLSAYRALVPAAAALLAPGGRLLVEVGAAQAEAVAAILAAAGLERIACHADLAGTPRVVDGCAAVAVAPGAARVEVAV